MKATVHQHGSSWVSRVWLTEGHPSTAEYEVYEIDVIDPRGCPYFRVRDAPKTYRCPNTDDVTLAAVAISGTVHRDAQSESRFHMDGDGSYCGSAWDMAELGDVFRHVHAEADRLMTEAGA